MTRREYPSEVVAPSDVLLCPSKRRNRVRKEKKNLYSHRGWLPHVQKTYCEADQPTLWKASRRIVRQDWRSSWPFRNTHLRGIFDAEK